MKGNMFSIGEICRMCKINSSKLRYYDEKGIIKPCYVDEESGYRYYNEETFLLVSLLKYYQSCGFSLKELHPLLERWDLEHLEMVFDDKIESLKDERRRIGMQIDSVNAWKELIAEQRAAVLEEPQVRHVFYRDTVMLASVPYIWEGMSYDSLIANIEMCSHLNITLGALSVHYPEGDRTRFDNVKIYIQTHPLDTPTTQMEIVPGCGALTIFHPGPVDNAQESYEKIFAFAEEHGISLRGDSFERSVIDCWSTRVEDEYLLEIILPTTESIAGIDPRTMKTF